MPNQDQLWSLNALAEALHHERRSLRKWLAGVEPAGTRNGSPVYRLNDVLRAIEANRRPRSATVSAARERLLALQADKLEAQLKILTAQWIPVERVERDGALLGNAVRKIIESLPRMAPELTGLDVRQIAAILKAKAREVLTEMSNLSKRISEYQDAAREQMARDVIADAPADLSANPIGSESAR